MKRWENRQPVAVSVLAGDEDWIIERKLDTIRKLPRAPVRFFDAATHPLGPPELGV
jgi:hypothetical protein